MSGKKIKMDRKLWLLFIGYVNLYGGYYNLVFVYWFIESVVLICLYEWVFYYMMLEIVGNLNL